MAHRSGGTTHHARDVYFADPPHYCWPPPPHSDASPAVLTRRLRTFDETLRTRLHSLLLVPATTTTLSYLSRAVEVLRSVHAEAAQVISDPSLRGADDPAVSAYLDCSAALLDSCNAASARIDRLVRRRLLLALALHHLLLSDSPDTERVQKARKAVVDWEQETDVAGEEPQWTSRTGGDLIKAISFPRDPPPPGKSSSIARAVYAVEAVSALVGGMLLGSLFGIESVCVGNVPGEFGWSDAYNYLGETTTSFWLKSCPPIEVTTVESRARELVLALEYVNGGTPPVPMDIRAAAEALEEELERMTEGLDVLAGAVNGLFRTAMGARNAAIEGLRVDQKNCK